MKHKMFAVYDSKVEAYLQPFFMRTKGEALRAWSGAVSDPQTAFFSSPGDFTLFELGEYDDDSGTVLQYEHKLNLGTALEHKKQPTQAMEA